MNNPELTPEVVHKSKSLPTGELLKVRLTRLAAERRFGGHATSKQVNMMINDMRSDQDQNKTPRNTTEDENLGENNE